MPPGRYLGGSPGYLAVTAPRVREDTVAERMRARLRPRRAELLARMGRGPRAETATLRPRTDDPGRLLAGLAQGTGFWTTLGSIFSTLVLSSGLALEAKITFPLSL